MTTLALYLRLEAKPGKEQEVEALLRAARSDVMKEPGTRAWFALRLGPSTFAIFDAFADESGREAHLNGAVAAGLMARAPELFANQSGDHPGRRGGRQDLAVNHAAAVAWRGTGRFRLNRKQPRGGRANQDDRVALLLTHADAAVRRAQGPGDAHDHGPGGARIVERDRPLAGDQDVALEDLEIEILQRVLPGSGGPSPAPALFPAVTIILS